MATVKRHRFMTESSTWITLTVAALASATIWLLTPVLTSHREPWDADGGFYVVALVIAGPVAGGRAWWPWVSLRDVARILAHAVTSRVSGVVNAVGPTPATSGEVIRTISRHLGRPYWLPAPGWGIRLLLGQAGRELLLSSQKVTPAVLIKEKFPFSSTTVDQAVAEALD